MKQTIGHETYGEIVFTENAFTGKKDLTVNGSPLQKISKKEFRMPDGKTATITGGFFRGVSLAIDGETIRITPALKWYEAVLALIPFILIIVWGNSATLCGFVPVVGGAIGGGISGAFCVISLYAIKAVKPVWLKIVVGLAMTLATFVICWVVACAILGRFF